MPQSHNKIIPKNKQSFEKAAQSTKIREAGIYIMRQSFLVLVYSGYRLTLISVRIVKQVAIIAVQTWNVCEKNLGHHEEDPNVSRITFSSEK